MSSSSGTELFKTYNKGNARNKLKCKDLYFNKGSKEKGATLIKKVVKQLYISSGAICWRAC